MAKTHTYTILVSGSFTLDVEASSPEEALEESQDGDMYQLDSDTWFENERSIYNVDGEEYVPEEK